MTEKEKNELIARAVTHIIQDRVKKEELWRYLFHEVLQVMAKVVELEKKVDIKEIEAKIKAKKKK